VLACCYLSHGKLRSVTCCLRRAHPLGVARRL